MLLSLVGKKREGREDHLHLDFQIVVGEQCPPPEVSTSQSPEPVNMLGYLTKGN